MLEKFVTEFDADGVFAEVVRAGIAFTVAIKTGKGISAARLESRAKNVLDHNRLG